MKVRKFNESKEEPTYRELLDLVESGNIVLINADADRFGTTIRSMVRLNGDRLLNRTIGDMDTIAEDFVFVSPNIIIGEGEITNPFEFGDVVIVPGHDSITCYNRKTGKHQTSYIR